MHCMTANVNNIGLFEKLYGINILDPVVQDETWFNKLYWTRLT